MRLLLALLSLVILDFFVPGKRIDQNALREVQLKKMRSAIGCSVDWNNINIDVLANEMVPLPGAGKWKFSISTTNDSAQFYFNQGMNLYYGFHIIEAVPSFRKAQQFDPACGMLYWGEALALGPNINDIGYAASREAKTAADNAHKNLARLTAKEKSLVSAMELRYSKDSTADQSKMNGQYADAMRNLFKQYQGDPDIGSLFADALMLLHPWDFWENDGRPKAWTPEITSLLEKVLIQSPDHPGANHYFIHTIEASPNPERAKKSADRLGELAPSLSHLVHMPSHIYIRTGEFEKGVRVNTEAVKGYELYKSMIPSVTDKVDLYEIHNRHMQVACALNLTDYPAAIELAGKCRKSIPADWLTIPNMGFWVQYIYLSPELVMIANQHWDEILQQPDMPDSLVYAKILQHFSKGLAYASKGDLANGNRQLAYMENLMKDTMLNQMIGPMNAPISGSKVAKSILEGVLFDAVGNSSQALASFKKAVEFEDAMVYNEPKDWLLPARGWLGESLKKAGQAEKARKVFETDLQKNPGSLMAIKGLRSIKN
jgi:tetratricopeptide (TPR) repeat protein